MITRRADELDRGDTIVMDIVSGAHKGEHAMKVQRAMQYGAWVWLDLEFPNGDLFFTQRHQDAEEELLMPEKDPDNPAEEEDPS